MKTSINDIRNLVKKINEKRGFTEVNYNTIGAIRLYQDICGIAIDEVMNDGGGVRRLEGGGLTKNEAYMFLSGLLNEEG